MTPKTLYLKPSPFDFLSTQLMPSSFHWPLPHLFQSLSPRGFSFLVMSNPSMSPVYLVVRYSLLPRHLTCSLSSNTPHSGRHLFYVLAKYIHLLWWAPFMIPDYPLSLIPCSRHATFCFLSFPPFPETTQSPNCVDLCCVSKKPHAL